MHNRMALYAPLHHLSSKISKGPLGVNEFAKVDQAEYLTLYLYG